jgi:uncharacterized protein YecT (DUF1311 family)
MHRAWKLIGCALVVVILAATARADMTRSPPAALSGIWDVEHVAVDRADQMHWEAGPDDPRLLGLELVISRAEVRFGADETGCESSAWQPSITTWEKLFRKGLRRPPGGGRSTRPSPADFELAVAKRAPVTAYLLCRTNSRATDAWLHERWVAVHGSDVLIMHYSNQVLLVLKRRALNAKPIASFPCSKAVTPTEKTICGSFNLAARDRSVAAAYHQALERSRNDQLRLRTQQTEWLRKRDDCGSNADCLDELLWQQVWYLVQQ